MNNLVFYDKEGNYLNFNWNQTLERYEGDILFHENSNDTFKTQALYTFEKIPSFEYENQNSLTLRRWQLFNEFGFHFYNSEYVDQKITLIEPTNNRNDYFSKWIYGDNFHEKFPNGTLIRFNQPIFEFTNSDRLYTVVSSKRDAILIISSDDNQTFTSFYSFSTYAYGNETISSVDVIGIYDYVNSSTLTSNLSDWNERDFFNRLYKERKLNIVNSFNNDNYQITDNQVPKRYIDAEVVSVKNENITDIRHFEWRGTNLPLNDELNISVKLLTDLPVIYTGIVEFYDSSTPLIIGGFNYPNVIRFGSLVPEILLPGVQFNVRNTALNQQNYTVSSIPQFLGNANLITYNEGVQVIWNNRIYQCIQTHDWVLNAVDVNLPFVTNANPDNSTYWSTNITYVPVNPAPTSEGPLNTDVYLTTDEFTFTQSFTQSSEITLSLAVDRFSERLSSLNIDLMYENGTIRADLIYPSQYALVDFTGVDSLNSVTNITSQTNVWERAIEVEENLNSEYNYDFSENFEYNLVFTDIDEFGIVITINGESYDEDVEFVFSSGQIDMERTIHQTLINWYQSWAPQLLSLGVIVNLQTVDIISLYYNSIKLETEYPNIPLDFKVQVGITADFYIQNKRLQFYEPSQLASTIPGYAGASFSLGNYINIVVNNRSYGITHSLPDPISSLSTTLENWVDTYGDILDDFGIYVENNASSIEFRTKSQTQRCDIEVRVGSSVLPGDKSYEIIDLQPGNHGTLLTSNEILLGTYSSGTQSLEGAGFATGMITGINGTFYPLQNVEYNILYLEPQIINLSYEGPFWGLTSGVCLNSPFTIVAFNNGFQKSICATSSQGGQFNQFQFNSSYNIQSQSTTYSTNFINGLDNMVDLVWVPPTNSIFVLGSASTTGDLFVYDSITSDQIVDLNLPNNSQPLKIIYNWVDNYVWALSVNHLWQIDPYSNSVIQSFPITFDAFSLDFNRNNGEVWVTTDNSIEVFNTSGLITSISYAPGFYHLVFNDFEGDFYISSRNGSDVLRYNGNTRTLSNTYTIVGLTDDPLIYETINESVYVWGTNLNRIDNNLVITLFPNSGSFNDFEFSNITNGIYLSTDSEFSLWDINDDTYEFNTTPGYYGFQALNSYDGDIYISNQDPGNPGIYTLGSQNGSLNNVVFLSDPTTRIISNPDRNSVWAIQPNTNGIIEVQPLVTNIITPISSTFSPITANYFGSLDPNFIQRNYLWLHTKDFLRRPRLNFNGDVKGTLYWKWFSDNVPEFFLYDFSGDLLDEGGVLSYVGPKPLPKVHLNRNPNRDIDKVNLPEYQQTIFPIVYEELSYIDDNDDLSIVPEPIETYIGFNSQLEGGLRSILQLYIKEDIDFTLNTKLDTTDVMTFQTVINQNGERIGEISLDVLSNSNFFTDVNGVTRGLKVGQHLAIFVNDVSNTKNQYISPNNGYLVKIKQILYKKIRVEFFKEIDAFSLESSIVQDYPKSGEVTYLSVRFRVWDKEIGRFNIYGQTEIEDVRYKIGLGNVGKLVSSDAVYIFKEYDIEEEGIDWTFLNKKRKEMLMMKSLIYPYIGSYKAIINAINYFGYNDLELNEYYRNINPLSKNYFKLFKVEIPDIFSPYVDTWNESDFLKNTFPNPNYEETNLFNLTYRITDRQGNNVLNYTLKEVQIKLQGLKHWLEKNIIPITHKILDITGRADFVGTTTISHIVRDVNIIKTHEDFTPVSFKLNELYLMPVNNGSTVYNCVLDFYLKDDNNQFYPGVSKTLPDYYTIDIRSYQIYREWYPFKNYQTGDKVVYFNKLYESQIDNNKTNNPRKYESVNSWQSGTIYSVGDVVEYQRDYYVYSGYGFTGSGLTGSAPTASVVSPLLDSDFGTASWLNITEWKQIDMRPIQKITERRRIDNLYPFNFTIDSNIDPYLVIEVSSENGYGGSYRDKNNYEIKGILDIRELESFSNLTSKQYTNLVIPIVNP